MKSKDNSGAVFQNDRKETDKHPDRTGQCTIDGREYWISGWLEKTKDGKPYLSLKFKPKEATRQGQTGGKQYRDDSESIPF